MAAEKYLLTGDHPITLASGRPAEPGDRVPASALDDEADRWLIDDGLLIDDRAAREAAEKAAADAEKAASKG